MDEKHLDTSAGSINIDSTLDEISRELRTGETLILDVGEVDHNQTDVIFDTLVMRGYNVKRQYVNGMSQIIIRKPPLY